MKNQQITKECERCGNEFKCSPSHAPLRKNCSLYCANHGVKKNTGRTQFKKGFTPWNKGLHIDLLKGKDRKEIGEKISQTRMKNGYRHDLQTKIKISSTQQGITIDKWERFKITENKRIRESKEYKIWRNLVFLRDNYTCQNCFKNKCYLEAHHIKPFSKFPELRFEVSNGITYCKTCHINLDPYRGKRNKVKGGNIMKNNMIINVRPIPQ